MDDLRGVEFVRGLMGRIGGFHQRFSSPNKLISSVSSGACSCTFILSTNSGLHQELRNSVGWICH